jgi:hypothetical protein
MMIFYGDGRKRCVDDGWSVCLIVCGEEEKKMNSVKIQNINKEFLLSFSSLNLL